jgi:hypothetical protein
MIVDLVEDEGGIAAHDGDACEQQENGGAK